MKKFLALALAVLMALTCLAGCATTGNGPSLADAVAYLESLYKDGAKETPVDYDVVGKVLVNNVEFKVTWATDSDKLSVKESDKAGFYTIDVPDKTEAEIAYKLKATVTDGFNSKTVEFDRVVPIVDNTELVEKPELNVAYKLYLVHANLGQTLYAVTETQDDKYIKTTMDPKEGADFFVEEVEGGFKFYTTINGKKSYVTAAVKEVEEGKFSKFIYYSAEGSVWYYKSNLRAWFTSINGGEYVMGTYSSYKTISISEASYITEENTGKTQFPAVLIKKEVAEAKGVDSNVDIYKTGKDIVNAAYKLEAGKYLSGGYEYTLTGKIIKIDTPYSKQYGNVTVTIVVNGMTDKPIQLFRLKGNGADKLEVGNTVTAKGPIVNYAFKDDEGNVTGTKVEMEYPSIVSHNGTGEGAGDTTVNVKFEAVTAPVAGTAYKMFIAQNNIGKLLYLKGATQDNQGKYILSSTKASEGVDVYVEKSGSGYKFYATIGGAKKYLKASTTTEGEKVSKFLNWDTTGSVFTYKKAENAWFTTISGAEYVIGTYNTYETASLSEGWRMTAESTGSTQFPIQLVTKAAAEQAPEVKPDEPEVPDTPATTGGTVWTYDSSVKAWTTTIGSDKYFFGSYYNSSKDTTYETISLSQASYLNATNTGVTQFPAVLVANGSTTSVTAPVAGTKYKVMMNLTKISKKVYALGTATDSANKFIATTATASQAVDVYAEAATGGYKFYILDGTTKKYLNAKLEGTSKYIAWEAVGTTTPDTPDTPDTPVVPDTGAVVPVAGTAYKFGMVHAGVSTTDVYYINGQMVNTYYFGTTTDKTAGLDVYLETTTGGYYLYTTIGGAKKYINMEVSGTHVNGKYQDAATTVYTIDTANKTVAADVSGVSYIFGTSASKTFTTVGPVKAADENYFLQFYATDATGGEGEGEQTLTPAEIVAKAFELSVGGTLDGTQTLTGIITKIDTAFSTQYNNITVTIAVEALGDKQIQCYRLKKGDSTTNDQLAALVVGDTITVSGTVKNNNGTIRFDAGCTADAIKTAASIVTDLYALGQNKSMPQKYALTGVISNIASAWSDQYSNISVDMIVGGDTAHPVQAFRIQGKDAAGQVIDAVKNLAVGDTITVYGTLKHYYKDSTGVSTYEFDSGCELVDYRKAPQEMSIADAAALTTSPKFDVILEGTVESFGNNGTTYGNFYIQDTSGNKFYIYGLYKDGVRYDAMTEKPVVGDTVKVVGAVAFYNNAPQIANAELLALTPAGSGSEGGEGGSGSEGGEGGSGSEATPTTLATFELGDNVAAGSKTIDANSTSLSGTKQYTANGYTLSLTGLTKVYDKCYDDLGNSCFKLGASSSAGSFSFTVPENVTSVTLKVTGYKAKPSKIQVNGTTTTINSANTTANGQYQDIVIDTTSTKTVSVTTVSGGYRVALNTIIFTGTPA